MDELRSIRTVRVAARAPRRSRLALRFGLLAALVVLSRLDSIWLIGTLVLLLVVTALRARTLVRRDRALIALLVAAIPGLALGAYAIVNVSATGHVVPISGTLKSSFPHVDLSLGYLRQYKAYMALLALGAAGSAVALLPPFRAGTGTRCAHPGRRARGALDRGVRTSRRVLVVLRRAAARRPPRTRDPDRRGTRPRRGAAAPRRVVRWASVGVAIVLVGAIGYSVRERTADGSYAADTGWRIEAQRAGRWAGAHLPKHAMLSMVNSGAFGYYTPQEVMNLDGVISSYQYADAVCAGHLTRELRSAHVEYLASHSVPPNYQTIEVSVPCWGGRNTILSLPRRRRGPPLAPLRPRGPRGRLRDLAVAQRPPSAACRLVSLA